jgi:hypothetical protein
MARNRRNLQRADAPKAAKPDADQDKEQEPEPEQEAAAESEEGSETVHGSEPEAEPARESAEAEPENGLNDVSVTAGEVGFRVPVAYTAAVERIIMDCPPRDAVSNRERDVLKSAFSAIQEVEGNPDMVPFEAFLTTHEGADTFPMTFRMTARAGNGELPWVGIIDTNENPAAGH